MINDFQNKAIDLSDDIILLKKLGAETFMEVAYIIDLSKFIPTDGGEVPKTFIIQVADCSGDELSHCDNNHPIIASFISMFGTTSVKLSSYLQMYSKNRNYYYVWEDFSILKKYVEQKSTVNSTSLLSSVGDNKPIPQPVPQISKPLQSKQISVFNIPRKSINNKSARYEAIAKIHSLRTKLQLVVSEYDGLTETQLWKDFVTDVSKL